MRLRGALCCLFAGALALGPAWAQEHPKAPEPKKSNVAARAWAQCNDVDGQTLVRFNLLANNGDDADYVAFAEYESGQSGIWAGGEDPKGDKLIVVDQRNAYLALEILARGEQRRADVWPQQKRR